MININWNILQFFWQLCDSIFHEHNLVIIGHIVSEYVIDTCSLVDVFGDWVGELGKAKVVEVMVLAVDHDDVSFHDSLTLLVLWHHTHDGLDQDPFGSLLSNHLVGELFETTRVPSMMSVQFLLHLAASHEGVINVHNDAGVDNVGGVLGHSGSISLIPWSVFSTDKLRNEDGHPAHWHSLGIEQVVSMSFMVYSNVH